MVYMHATTTFPTTMTPIAILFSNHSRNPGTWEIQKRNARLTQAHCANVPLQLPTSGQQLIQEEMQAARHGTRAIVKGGKGKKTLERTTEQG
jgi:hypothetical protein